MIFDKAWVIEMQKRADSNWQDEPGETESPLQRRIVQDAKARGWPAHDHPMSQHHIKAHGASDWGWGDVTLCIPGGPLVKGKYLARGRVLILELKAKKGTARQSQVDMARICKFLNIEYHVVKTWKRYLEIINL